MVELTNSEQFYLKNFCPSTIMFILLIYRKKKRSQLMKSGNNYSVRAENATKRSAATEATPVGTADTEFS